jgi:Zn-dependent metalloprotease
MRFDPKLQLNESEVGDWLKAQFHFDSELQFTTLRTEIGLSGIKHTSYSVKLNDVDMEFLRITVHSMNGIALSVSGNILPDYSVSNIVTLTQGEALKFALREINAKEYKWQIPSEEEWIKETTGDPSASYFPSSSMVVISPNADYDNLDLRYAHKFDIYASKPLSREEIYVDAQTGEVLLRNSLMKEIDTLGTAQTGFSGMKQITTDYYFAPPNQFRLRESDRGNGINTWNLQTKTNLSHRIDFVDDDNVWIDNTNLNEFATDAHWAAELTYDYFYLNFGRNSIDNNGFQLNNYVHYGEAYQNARWDGQQMLFGDGIGNPFTTVDISGHEITHGLTDFTADLVYLNEPGALNESFSDIFGNCIEYFGKPSTASWRIGEDRGSYFRDMSNPNLRSNPDTYQGLHWYSGTEDFGGVHTNSGVQNFWFYLLTVGGNGINDAGKSYDVKGIGFANSAQIAYENLTSYLSPLSDYEEARFYSIVAAVDIFGNCSAQHAATVNAWYAVGLGDEFIDHAVAAFDADRLEFCDPPFTVNFTNNSVNGMSYLWDFGDGGSSSDQSPSHTYTSLQDFTVKLSVDGDGCGLDEKISDNFIQVSHPAKPVSTNASISSGQKANLSAQSTTGNVYWYKDENGSEIIHIGNQFVSEELYSDTAFYIQSVLEGRTSEVGLDINASLNIGAYSSSNLSLVFDMLQNATIESIKVNAGTEGERTFVIKDKFGTKVYEKNIMLTAGIQEVTLGAEIAIGNDYEMYVASTNGNLWRSTGPEYPFQIPGLCVLKESSIGLDIYPYFYNLKVKENDCTSELVQVKVGVDDYPGGIKKLYNFYTKQGSDARYTYFVRFDFLSKTSITYGLYSISGQKSLEITPPAYNEGPSGEINLNELLNLNSFPGGVYFLTIKGGEIEKSERLIIKSGTN